MRKPPISSNTIYHIYNRGVSKRIIFRDESDYKFFMHRIKKFKNQYLVQIVKFCLMSNHYHLLLYTEAKKHNIPMFMKSLQLSYSLHFNKKYDHSGHVFQGTYKSKEITDPIYYNKIIEYIANNPVRKGLVKNAADWPYSG